MKILDKLKLCSSIAFEVFVIVLYLSMTAGLLSLVETVVKFLFLVDTVVKFL